MRSLCAGLGVEIHLRAWEEIRRGYASVTWSSGQTHFSVIFGETTLSQVVLLTAPPGDTGMLPQGLQSQGRGGLHPCTSVALQTRRRLGSSGVQTDVAAR